MIAIAVVTLALAASAAPAILIDYDEIHDQYCVPDNVSSNVMAGVEDCFQMNLADFKVRTACTIRMSNVSRLKL